MVRVRRWLADGLGEVLVIVAGEVLGIVFVVVLLVLWVGYAVAEAIGKRIRR